MPAFTEKSVVEDYFVKKLQERGWRFVSADDLGLKFGITKLQNLKALKRAPLGTLAFRSYPLIRYGIVLYDKASGI